MSRTISLVLGRLCHRRASIDTAEPISFLSLFSLFPLLVPRRYLSEERRYKILSGLYSGLYSSYREGIPKYIFFFCPVLRKRRLSCINIHKEISAGRKKIQETYSIQRSFFYISPSYKEDGLN